MYCIALEAFMEQQSLEALKPFKITYNRHVQVPCVMNRLLSKIFQEKHKEIIQKLSTFFSWTEMMIAIILGLDHEKLCQSFMAGKNLFLSN